MNNEYFSGYVEALGDIVEYCNVLLDDIPFNSPENLILDNIVMHTIDLIFKLEQED